VVQGVIPGPDGAFDQQHGDEQRWREATGQQVAGAASVVLRDHDIAAHHPRRRHL
jgi:hypothetical protein